MGPHTHGRGALDGQLAVPRRRGNAVSASKKPLRGGGQRSREWQMNAPAVSAARPLLALQKDDDGRAAAAGAHLMHAGDCVVKNVVWVEHPRGFSIASAKLRWFGHAGEPQSRPVQPALQMHFAPSHLPQTLPSAPAQSLGHCVEHCCCSAGERREKTKSVHGV